jgi:hypothetical protein
MPVTGATRSGVKPANAARASARPSVKPASWRRLTSFSSNSVLIVSDLGSLGAARVDHHHPAAARLQRLEAAAEVGHGHQAAVGGHRVGAHDQEILRAVDVADRQQQLVAVHPVGDQLVRQLVHRGGGEPVAGLERAEEMLRVGQAAVVVHAGIALVHADGIAAVLRADLRQPLGHPIEGLVPADLLPAAVDATHRPAQPVGILVNVLERHRLGTDVAVREGIKLVAADGQDFSVLHLELEAADGLAQVAGAVAGFDLGHGCSPPAAGVNLSTPRAPRQLPAPLSLALSPEGRGDSRVY